jgi:DNA mismatch repair protein MutS2
MAQSGIPVPAEEAKLPLFTSVYADIGDAQSIERNLSSFSAHIVNLDRISREATDTSLVLLDELGSATDPEEGAALAVAIATHFLAIHAWCCITTHLTSLKVYAANHPGVLNAAVGFDQQTLTPTYEVRLGVPGASAGLNIAARLGLQPDIITAARSQMTTQTADIGAFLDQLHEQLTGSSLAKKRASKSRAASNKRPVPKNSKPNSTPSSKTSPISFAKPSKPSMTRRWLRRLHATPTAAWPHFAANFQSSSTPR